MKKKPFFSKFLENQNENLEDVKGGIKIVIEDTMKYPSDNDEGHQTMKYPSDHDEGTTMAYPNDQLEVM